jgi:nucleotide-binding universal stress UspA family protein
MMAYDGSTRAKEALFLAAYMGVFWEFTIDVVSVQDKQDLAQQTLENARAFLESYGKSAGYIQKTGEVPDSIFQAATEKGSDLILIGGHSSRWIKEAVYGSTVDHILSESPLPVLVCN